jgi:hypothetical protein
LINGIAHETTDQADHAVGRQHARSRIAVARDGRAFHIIERLDQIVDAEWNRGHEDHAEKLKTGEHVIDCRQRHRETERRERLPELLQTHPPKL